MTETLHRTALSVGGRQGGQELEATQTEQPLSDLDFLILNGMDTAQSQEHLNDGIPLEELANAARGIVSRGESLADEPEAEDIPEEKAKPERQTKPQLTVDRLDEWLADNGISVSYNCISHAVEVEGVDPCYNPETVKSDLHIIVHDQLKRKYQCDRGLVADLLGVLAGKHRYNPVEVMLKNAPAWDGVDRVEQLYKILCIEDDELSKTLLYKWLWQCYSMAHNDTKHPFGADGLLVLQGKQGIGKTSFVRKIGVLPELVKLGQYLDSRDKDTIRRCTSCWICEWGEVESTLRSDLERLKAFITAEIDEYRLPYGRTDQAL